MDLKSYMTENKISGEKLAEMVGNVTGAAVRLWMTGARMPAPEAVEKIVRLTEGQVTIQDLHEARMSFIRAEKDAAA